jgi:sugar transferase (PEP-CTERM/EpsH1 system associated)
MSKNILFISHRIPAPPNKGDKIRSYNFIRNLSENHNVHLAFLVDSRSDIKHVEMLRQYTKNIFWESINPKSRKVLSTFKSITSSQPISLPYFYSQKLQQKIDRFLDNQQVDAVFCFSSPTAEYLYKSKHVNGMLQDVRWVMDLIDVDSYKWKQYAENNSLPLKWIYKRESDLLQRYEKKIAHDFDATLLVSKSEAQLFNSNCQDGDVRTVPNGVDLQHFAPGKGVINKFGGPVLVFTGAMDYWPNIDGVTWFVKEVFPLICLEVPNTEFFIVGSYPAPEVIKLQETEGVSVTGFVDDVRDYLASADVCVIPLRIARGIQNKVLEAMAMGKPIVCSPEALEGIDAVPGKDLLTAKSGAAFAREVVRLLGDAALQRQIAKGGRECVEEKYSWEKSLGQLEDILFERGASG